MKRVGAHVSVAGGVENAPVNAEKINAKAFALFTKNQRQWRSKPLTQKSIEKFVQNRRKVGIEPDAVLPHSSYLINPGSPDPTGLEKSRAAFTDEMQRCEQLGLKYLNFHPGNHLKQVSVQTCIRTIADSINLALDKTENVIAVIENTAGQGSSVGYDFAHIADIIDLVDNKSRVGVCIDTCHLHAAGYDIRSAAAFEKTMAVFDDTIGLKYLKGLHLNDSKKPMGSRVDRHECIGKGEIGIEAFRFIMNAPVFENLPLILETPDSDNWAKEIRLLYSLQTD